MWSQRMIKDKLKARIRELLRRSVRVLDWQSNRDVEYSFARRQVVGAGARVLDVGGIGGVIHLNLARADMQVSVYDFREYPEKHPNITSIQGDFLKNDLPDDHFDYVMLISAIEHVGFGGYGDPEYDDGDFEAFAEVKRVLKPDGKIVITFPFAGEHRIIPGFERWYDIERVRRLFDGMEIIAEEYYMPRRKVLGRWIDWVSVSLEQIKRVYTDQGCQGCACYVVSPVPPANFP